MYSSNLDTFSIAVVEAMMNGTPVMINDIPPFLEIFSKREYAEVFESKNSSSLFSSLGKLLLNNEYTRKLAVKEKILAIEIISISSDFKELQNVYYKIVHKV